MMTIRCVLALTLLAVPVRADETVLLTLETYSVPAATWMKIPTAMRDDPTQLRTTLLGQVPKGTITLRDRLGGPGRSAQKLTFGSQKEVQVPSGFEANEAGFYPVKWRTWKVGSLLELEASFSKSARMSYRLVGDDAPLRALVETRRRFDLARAQVPMFPVLYLDSDAPIAPVSLVAVAPDPDRQQRERRLLVCFLVMSGLPDNAEAAKRQPAYALELLALRGSTLDREVPPLELMNNLLRRSDAHVFSLVSTQIPGPRVSLEAVQEFPHPGRADDGPTGPVPSSVEAAPVGTILNAQLSPAGDGKVGAIIQVDHDWRDPVLPSIPGENGEPMDKTLITYKMQFRVREDIVPGDWALLTQQELSEVFGPDDRDTRDESCYLFGRLVIRE